MKRQLMAYIWLLGCLAVLCTGIRTDYAQVIHGNFTTPALPIDNRTSSPQPPPPTPPPTLSPPLD